MKSPVAPCLAGIAVLPFLLLSAADALVIRSYNSGTHLRISGFPATPTLNPTFLNAGGDPATLLDLTGVGWSADDSQKQFTLMSPRHFVGANHFPPAIGSNVKFLARDNTVHTFKVGSIATIPNPNGSNSDLFLAELTTEIPATVPILPLPYLNLASETAYVGQSLVVTGKLARGGRGVIGSVSDFGGDPITGGSGIQTRAITFTYGVAGSVDDARCEGGDSGSPSFAVRSGKAALVGTHTAVLNALGSVTTYDTLVPHYADELNARMETTGLRLRKIDPAANSFTLAGEVLNPVVRAGKPFTVRMIVTNSAALAENVTLDLMPAAAGLVISSITAPGWYRPGDSTLRRGNLAASASSTIDVGYQAAPAPGPILIPVATKADGSSQQIFQTGVMVLPSFANWAAGLQDPGLEGDSDQDGISNLLEYATGGDNLAGSRFFPGESGEPLLPHVSGNLAELIYLRRTDAAVRGLSYHVETSGDLQPGTWQPVVDPPETSSAGPGDGFEKVRLPISPAGGGRLFYRLRVELAE